MKKKLISVVVPIFNEEMGIKKFLDKELFPVLERLPYQTEIVLVDDGSWDGTLEKIRAMNTKIPMRIVVFSKNFGKEIALTAGIFYAKGDAIVMIDADGQHPAEAIPRLVEKWENGAEVVTALRGQNTTRHRLGSRIYYRLLRMMGMRNFVPGELDFRLIDRAVADEFNKFTEHNRLTRGLINWLGFKQEYIKVETKGRIGGRPTYGFKKLMALAGDSMVSMSRTPLIIFGYIGIFITVVSVIFGLFILIQQYILGDPLGLDWSGAVAMSVFVSFLVGLVLISQAITALYIAQIHIETKNRPLFVVDKKRSVGVDGDER
ncbi:glycosyltransferase family 2 protein [Candidatus Saccharibacteria bacterium]|nr:glycosyltransferase family 2 protein [Candidatus Saccharibacteria bacterium]